MSQAWPVGVGIVSSCLKHRLPSMFPYFSWQVPLHVGHRLTHGACA